MHRVGLDRAWSKTQGKGPGLMGLGPKCSAQARLNGCKMGLDGAWCKMQCTGLGLMGLFQNAVHRAGLDEAWFNMQCKG